MPLLPVRFAQGVMVLAFRFWISLILILLTNPPELFHEQLQLDAHFPPDLIVFVGSQRLQQDVVLLPAVPLQHHHHLHLHLHLALLAPQRPSPY